MAPFVFSLILAVSPQDLERVWVFLADGSWFPTAAPESEVILQTPTGEERIPFRDVRTLTRKGDIVALAGPGEKLRRGKLVNPEFPFQTTIGPLKIPARDIVEINRTGRRASEFVDSSTTALWWFGQGAADPARDLVEGRELKLHDMAVEEDSTGVRALTRKGAIAYAEVPADGGLTFPKGDFTLEARFRVGAPQTEWAIVLWKRDIANQWQRDYGIYVRNHGGLHWGGTVRADSPRVLDLQAWNTVAYVVEPAAGRMTFYVNGNRVWAQNSGGFSILATENPLILGAGPAAQGNQGTPEQIQFVRISNVARKDEEIAKMHRDLTEDREAPAEMLRGVHLRDGGFLRAEIQRPGSLSFVTKRGPVKVPPTSWIELCKYRSDDLEGVRKRVDELIEQLESQDIRDRERVRLALLEIGAAAIPQLRPHRKSEDLEVADAVDWILDRLDKSGESRRPVADVLHLGGSTIHGWLQEENGTLRTRYGTFQLEPRSIAAIRLRSARPPLVRLRSGESMEVEWNPESRIVISTDFGKCRVPVEEILSLAFNEASKRWTLKTRSTVLQGTLSGQLEAEAEVGPIAIRAEEIAEIVEERKR